MLELGSGNGFLVLDHLAHQLPAGSTVFLSDLESVVPLLEENIKAARSAGRLPETIDIHAVPLQWGMKDHVQPFVATQNHLSHILCSDLVYFPHLLEPLMRTLLWLTASDDGEDIEIIFGCKQNFACRLSRTY